MYVSGRRASVCDFMLDVIVIECFMLHVIDVVYVPVRRFATSIILSEQLTYPITHPRSTILSHFFLPNMYVE